MNLGKPISFCSEIQLGLAQDLYKEYSYSLVGNMTYWRIFFDVQSLVVDRFARQIVQKSWKSVS